MLMSMLMSHTSLHLFVLSFVLSLCFYMLMSPVKTTFYRTGRAVARTLIGGGCIFIYSCSARQVSFQIKFKLINLIRNLSGKT